MKLEAQRNSKKTTVLSMNLYRLVLGEQTTQSGKNHIIPVASHGGVWTSSLRAVQSIHSYTDIYAFIMFFLPF